MASTVLEMWQADAANLDGKSFAQIVQFCGDGRLRDDGQASKELRQLLAAVPRHRLEAFAEECLSTSFQESGFALQDIVNQIGVRLGFHVIPGQYRGTRNKLGQDGLWKAKDGHTLVVEVKTTDTYRINLDTIARYRELLIDDGELSQHSSIVIAVGRQDTGDLEAQIRGSRHAWDIRLISIDALLRLAAIKEEMNDVDTSNQINILLRPMEYTRLDAIVELLFATKRDAEEDNEENDLVDSSDDSSTSSDKTATRDAAREDALKRVEQKIGLTLVRKGRVIRSSSDGTTNVVCLVSRRYQGPSKSGNYWYGFTPAQRDFLNEAEIGYVVLVCSDSGRALLIERDSFLPWLSEFGTTPPTPTTENEIRHWHVFFNDFGSKLELVPGSGGSRRDITEFAL